MEDAARDCQGWLANTGSWRRRGRVLFYGFQKKPGFAGTWIPDISLSEMLFHSILSWQPWELAAPAPHPKPALHVFSSKTLEPVARRCLRAGVRRHCRLLAFRGCLSTLHRFLHTSGKEVQNSWSKSKRCPCLLRMTSPGGLVKGRASNRRDVITQLSQRCENPSSKGDPLAKDTSTYKEFSLFSLEWKIS